MKLFLLGVILGLSLDLIVEIKNLILFLIELLKEKLTNNHTLSATKVQKQINDISDYDNEPTNAIGFQYNENYEGEEDE